MQLTDTQTQLLKSWVVKKLEDISDADSDVLADYVLALVSGSESLIDVRQNSINNLKDFLQDSTERFVEEVLTAVQTGAYDPTKPVPTPSSSSSLKPQPPNAPRKRTFADRGDDDAAPNGRYSMQRGGDRPTKHPRRTRGGHDGGQPQWNGSLMPGVMPMNTQDAFAALLAMQQAMGFPIPPAMQHLAQNGDTDKPKNNRRCRDYDKKGFCARGAACRFSHGTDAVVVGQEYDPSQPLLLPEPNRSGHFDMAPIRGQHGSQRGRGRGGISRRGRGRAEFSLAGPSQDRSLTALVVEHIPEEKLDEQVITDFFTQYGQVQTVELQSSRRLAIVTFSSWEEANSAYISPNVIFDNRFVKVFWYKPGALSERTSTDDIEMKSAEPEIDLEEITLKQEEAQRKHDEMKKQKEEAQKQKAEIEAKLAAMDEERKRFAELLVKKSKGANAEDTGNADSNESEQTRGLKAQLAKLEAEAKILGIDTNVPTDDWQSQSWRGRGGYRGRGRFATRGSFRGAWSGPTRGGAVKRLDNRPRTLSIGFANGTFDQYEEALRQYLLFSDNLEHATLSRHSDRADAAVIAFNERYRAENFMAAAKRPTGIPNVGPVEVSWMNNLPTHAPATTSMDLMLDGSSSAVTSTPQQGMDTDADYDIAEEDSWL